LLWENFKNCGHCSINYEPTDWGDILKTDSVN
jgi:hypothetical protein